jgi:hypothetical protein
VSLKVVSVHSARPSLDYFLMRQHVYSTCRLGRIPSVMTRAPKRPGVLERTLRIDEELNTSARPTLEQLPADAQESRGKCLASAVVSACEASHARRGR